MPGRIIEFTIAALAALCVGYLLVMFVPRIMGDAESAFDWFLRDQTVERPVRPVEAVDEPVAAPDSSAEAAHKIPQAPAEDVDLQCNREPETLRSLVRSSLQGTKALMNARRLGFGFNLALNADVGEIWRTWIGRSGPNHAVLMLARSDYRRRCMILLDSTGIRAVVPVPDDAPTPEALHDDWRRLVKIDGIFKGVRAANPKDGLPETELPTRGVAVKVSGASLAAEGALLSKIYSAVFPGPIEQDIGRYSKVYILPFEGQGTIPFGALRNPKTGRALAESTDISILPSVEILFRDAPEALKIESKIGVCKDKQREMWRAAPDRIRPFVVGNPSPVSDAEFNFRDLPGAQREAAIVGRLFSEPVLGGSDATGEEFLARARGANPIHVASHGIADSDEPLRGALVLADGRLSAKQIQEDCFAAQLVVLSACQTGLGGVTAGGVIGVARAFQKAGADEVVMSLWSVDDEATVGLMQDFWTAYRTGPTKGSASAALRKAKLAARKRNPRTDLWAGFEVFGAPAPTAPP